jgi:hypothetical protein
MKAIAKLQEELKRADAALIAALAKAYPEGWRVRFNIQHGQVTPSRGEVVGHEGGPHAYLLVRLESRTHGVRHVAAANVIGRPERPGE